MLLAGFSCLSSRYYNLSFEMRTIVGIFKLDFIQKILSGNNVSDIKAWKTTSLPAYINTLMVRNKCTITTKF